VFLKKFLFKLQKPERRLTMNDKQQTGSAKSSQTESKSSEYEIITSYRELRVYKLAFDSAMRIFELSKSWPKEEKYSLTDQIRRASRSVCSNIGEAWRKRRYPSHFVSFGAARLLAVTD
jgi:hypothetical protein